MKDNKFDYVIHSLITKLFIKHSLGVRSCVRHLTAHRHRGFYRIIVEIQEQRPSKHKDFVTRTVKET